MLFLENNISVDETHKVVLILESYILCENEQKNGTSSRYLGVKKCADKCFGVELPLFHRDFRGDGIPQCTTSNGVPVLLRQDIGDEIVASKLYAYVCRILFGKSCFEQSTTKIAY